MLGLSNYFGGVVLAFGDEGYGCWFRGDCSGRGVQGSYVLYGVLLDGMCTIRASEAWEESG